MSSNKVTSPSPQLVGSAGEFMPRDLTEQSTLSVFVPDLCRVLRLTHQRSGLLSGLPYHRYVFSPESFDNCEVHVFLTVIFVNHKNKL